jgi:hypothetical protein
MGNDKKQVEVSTTEQLGQALAAGYEASQIVIKHPDASAPVETARTEGHTAGVDEGKKLGAAAERERIAAISTLAMDGFEKERDEAIASGASPEAFSMTQTKAIKERGITIAGIRSDAPPAAPGAAARTTNTGGDDATALLTTAMKGHNERSK